MNSELLKALIQLNTALISMIDEDKTDLEKALEDKEDKEDKDDYPHIVPYPC